MVLACPSERGSDCPGSGAEANGHRHFSHAKQLQTTFGFSRAPQFPPSVASSEGGSKCSFCGKMCTAVKDFVAPELVPPRTAPVIQSDP